MYIPKIGESLCLISDQLKTVNILIQALENRIQIEDTYQKSLLRISQKFSTANSNINVFGISVNQVGRIHAERAHQTNQCKEELKISLLQLKKYSKQVFEEVDNKTKLNKKMEKDFKINLEKAEKAKEIFLQSQKDLDEKVLLNQIGRLNVLAPQLQKKRLQQAAVKLSSQQKEIQNTFYKSVNLMKSMTSQFNQSVQKRNQQINNIQENIKNQLFDFLKKYSIHEINFLRNLEYDLNSWVKGIKVRQTQSLQKNHLDKIDEYEGNRQKDGWEQVRQQVLNQNQVKQEEISNQQEQSKLNKALQDQQYCLEYVKQISTKLPELKLIFNKCIKQFRIKYKNNIEDKHYYHLSLIFIAVCSQAFKRKDIDFINKILVYSMIFYKYKDNHKYFMIEQIKDQKFFSQIFFWRYCCFYNLRSIVTNFMKKGNQQYEKTQQNLKNLVYPALLTTATNMLCCGVDKNNTRNLIAKAAKVFSIGEYQISQLIKFIQSESDRGVDKKK